MSRLPSPLAQWCNRLERHFYRVGIKVGGGPLENKEYSGGAPTLTRTVCDMKPFFSNVTDWLSDGTAREQGV